MRQCTSNKHGSILRHTFWSRRTNTISPVDTDDVYQPFTYVHPSRQPGISSARYWRSPCHDLATATHPEGGLRCRDASHPIVADHALSLGCWILQSKSTEISFSRKFLTIVQAACACLRLKPCSYTCVQPRRGTSPREIKTNEISRHFPKPSPLPSKAGGSSPVPASRWMEAHPSGAVTDRRVRSVESEARHPRRRLELPPPTSDQLA